MTLLAIRWFGLYGVLGIVSASWASGLLFLILVEKCMVLLVLLHAPLVRQRFP